VAEEGAEIRIEDGARTRVAAARRLVEEKFSHGEAIYGVTTGFGRPLKMSIVMRSAM